MTQYIVSYRRVGARDTLVGGIIEVAGPMDYAAARDYADKANSKPFTPYFFFVERADNESPLDDRHLLDGVTQSSSEG